MNEQNDIKLCSLPELHRKPVHPDVQEQRNEAEQYPPFKHGRGQKGL